MLRQSWKLLFDYSVGIFYSTVDNWKLEPVGRKRFVAGELDYLAYGWILELAEHKPDYLPSVQEVTLAEQPRQRGPLFSLDEWEPPLRVDKGFDEARVKLRVLVRAPRRRD